tara:strand:+ start:1637 stop:2200 length:564 start_codon:yes stop_codon:yes gene_type:complete
MKELIKEQKPNLLEKTRTYLVGHMQYASGRDWRKYVESELENLNITTFNPYRKPFVKDVEEDEGARQRMADDLANGYYGDVAERMSTVRSYDLNLVDRSDFIVAHILPDVASWGSAEELVTAVRMKKPTFVSVEGGKNKTPLWLLGMMPHNYFYNDIDEVLDMIRKIDSGEKKIDSDRWRLLRKELR